MVLVSALLYGALQFSPQDIVNRPKEGQRVAFPDAYMVHMQDRTFNREGRLAHTLQASDVTYFRSGDTMQGYIEQPKLAFFGENDSPPWHLVATQGTASSDQQSLLLTGNVNAFHEHQRYGRIDVTTDNLYINTETQIATTDKPVTMQSARGTTSAIGLAADLESGRVELLSEVKGTYDPN
ncbi:LPS export ABC transporter periplasmic protein LptC [Gilvimarinus sp. SDUM040013]|uniref:LPS export ABC transporter periplasmic protein LptC n=1 Tax=Gilvimarinus gilvus TaxID=3058038 RepID=A0ABU4RY54_9GAMM|nr:LPS export ABC transporter periplasmic protein LptC [Gilvimarinus sp. SDUM040013]MDO3388349.1 LPS export ABC transporter periplasmic protein LptC [Gilvimarinus sp. SDUM040013]MDX6847899.1 LPS export ABC transporter periplasmic protein LptC [Gilvimarinus sp. SDUM040013]